MDSKSGKLTDSAQVHRVIISIHSKYFERCCAGGFSESEAHRVELKEDHEEAVGAM